MASNAMAALWDGRRAATRCTEKLKSSAVQARTCCRMAGSHQVVQAGIEFLEIPGT